MSAWLYSIKIQSSNFPSTLSVLSAEAAIIPRRLQVLCYVFVRHHFATSIHRDAKLQSTGCWPNIVFYTGVTCKYVNYRHIDSQRSHHHDVHDVINRVTRWPIRLPTIIRADYYAHKSAQNILNSRNRLLHSRPNVFESIINNWPTIIGITRSARLEIEVYFG